MRNRHPQQNICDITLLNMYFFPSQDRYFVEQKPLYDNHQHRVCVWLTYWLDFKNLRVRENYSALLCTGWSLTFLSQSKFGFSFHGFHTGETHRRRFLLCYFVFSGIILQVSMVTDFWDQIVSANCFWGYLYIWVLVSSFSSGFQFLSTGLTGLCYPTDLLSIF